ncbi:hypothetical protein ILUMI_14462, partial [Ignelater luminosus]
AWKPLRKLFSHPVLSLSMKVLFPWERTFVHALLFGMRNSQIDLKTISSHSMPILFLREASKLLQSG